MRRWIASVVALVGLGLVACEAELERGRLGEEPRVEQEAPLEGEGVLGGEDLQEQEFRGTVTGLSEDRFILRNEQGVERPFEIGERTDFIHRGQPVGRSLLREGEQVRTTYDEEAGEWIADEVEIY